MTAKLPVRATLRMVRLLGGQLPELRPLDGSTLCRHDDIVVECVCVVASPRRPVSWPSRYVVIPIAGPSLGHASMERLAWPNGAPSRSVTLDELESSDGLAALAAEMRRQFELDAPAAGLATRALDRLIFPRAGMSDVPLFGRSVLELVLG
jgi:hypothetical protein